MDHAATTPVRAEVVDAMQPYFSEFYGNPSSLHAIGRQAGMALSNARRTVAGIMGARETEILFTSCGTESDNTALRGLALARRQTTGANRVITTAVEHKAVLENTHDLAEFYGFDLTLLPVDADGLVNVDDVAEALGDGREVAIVSVMYANNEVGTIQPIAEIGSLCHARGVPLHTDAVQAAGRLSLDVTALHVDALSISAHKFYGPKGVGALYLRRGTPFHPLQRGGSHEAQRRAGTENVPLIVGLARALEIAEAERESENARLSVLRDRLIGGILEIVAGARLTGSQTQRLPHLASFVIRAAEAEGILIGLDLAGIAASSGSACTSGSQRPSHVLEAMGVPGVEIFGQLRFSLGCATTAEDVEYVLVKLPQIVHQMQA